MSEQHPHHIGDMDVVDERQQREIDANRVWLKAISIMATVILVGFIACFILLMRALNCPHLDCPHHIFSDQEQSEREARKLLEAPEALKDVRKQK